jgi:Bacterial extracellular solute-binding proteins, family 5 Middle
MLRSTLRRVPLAGAKPDALRNLYARGARCRVSGAPRGGAHDKVDGRRRAPAHASARHDHHRRRRHQSRRRDECARGLQPQNEVAFHLNRPQPAFIALLAAGVLPVYPCLVTPAEMRLDPVGTGPFKFVEFKPNESIKLVRNPDYWKKGRPYLDGIEYTIIPNRSTAILAFVTGKFDTFLFQVSLPLLKDLKSRRRKQFPKWLR